jgi:hypothetical protein
MKCIFLRHSISTLLFLLVIAAAALINAQPEGISVTSANVFGVTSSNQLIRFNSSSPSTVVMVGPITGLQAGENIVGIDFRPATGELFALGNTSRLYVLNKSTAAASQVAVLSIALSGTTFGVDFNPTVDRFRIVSNTGQNLRVNPINGVAINDTAINGPASGADAAAYTNSFNGSTSTTLYDISSATDTLYLQGGLNGSPSPNGGVLTAVGPLGIDVTDVNGFDILSADGTAFAALTTSVSPVTSLYTINLATGGVSSIGAIGSGSMSITGLAVEIGATTNSLAFGVTTANNLVQFNSLRPNAILRSVAITGLQPSEDILGIDFRPATGQLFGLGSTSRLYVIDTLTGAATQVGNGQFTTLLNGTSFGVDFNPTVDRLRIVSNTGQNLRLNPTNAAVAGVDTALNGGASGADSAAYTNSFVGPTTTTLYDISSNTDVLYTQGGVNGTPSPNGGVLTAVGPLGVNIASVNGFDIVSGNNTALAAFQSGTSSNSSLYTVDLTTGSAAIIGPIGGGVALRGFAITRSSASSAATALDFDGDGRTDEVVFRPSINTWFIRRSSDGITQSAVWGEAATDIFVPGDYDGDGKTDIAVWRPSNGTFFVIQSSNNSILTRAFGIAGDEPVARDYDGDGKTDFAVVRRSAGVMTWFIQNSSNGFFISREFGVESDIVTPGDYDGDGRFDLAVRRGIGSQPATFYLQQSTAGYSTVNFGLGADLVVPGDYDGDGKTDVTALRQGTTYTWFVIRSSNQTFNAVGLGRKPDFPTQGDYDGDGKTDFSIWDPNNAAYRYFRSSNDSLAQTVFGQNGDYPVANYDTH